MTRYQSLSSRIAALGRKWGGCARVLATVIALAVVLGIGSFIYNDIWKSKTLTYTVLGSYDLGENFFSGMIVENRGRAPLTEIQIIFSDLESLIEVLHMPEPHELAEVTSGGEGHNNAVIEMPRLPETRSLSIYLLTAEQVTLSESETFLVSSKETVGKASTEEGPTILGLAAYGVGSFTMIVTLIIYVYRSITREQPEK